MNSARLGTFSFVDKVWANVKPTSAREFTASRQTEAAIDAIIKAPYRTLRDVSATWIIMYDGQLPDIQSVVEIGYREGLQILCRVPASNDGQGGSHWPVRATATLSKLPGVLQEKLGQQALSAAAAVIQEESPARHAAHHGEQTGSTAKRITAGKAGAVRFPGNPSQNITQRTSRRPAGPSPTESGQAGKHGTAGSWRLAASMPAARPFMRPAVDARATEATDTFSKA